MNIKKLHNLFLLPLLLGLLSIVMPGCSDDDEVLQSEYGYVQFKLYKGASFGADVASRAAANDQLDSLYDAKKIKVILEYNGTQVSQTLPLHSYNAENAEFGLRSDKLQLTTGTYNIIGYYLYNKLDQQVLAGSVVENNSFNVVSGGLEVKALPIETAKRGLVQFKLEKTGLSRAEGAYLFSSIRLIDVTVTNTFTRESKQFKKLKVRYKEDFLGPEEYEKPEDLQTDDQYKKIGTAKCDSAVWLPAGTYRVTSYTTYSKNGSVETALETQPVEGKTFTISDNVTNTEAVVPIKLSETFEYIKDYLALRAIWEAMDGKNWSFYGDAAPHGTNWDFNKELDMWGEQPGVSLNNQGRVVGLVLAGFGAKGILPDAVGQLTELEVLNLGSHDEKVGGHMYQDADFKNGLNEQQKKNMRYHYEKHFLKYDPRADMSEMIVNNINNDPTQKRINKNSRITLKDTQIGVMTSKIEGVSKAIYRLTKLQQFYIGNAPVTHDKIATTFTDADKADSPYKVYSEEFTEDAWSKMTSLTDIELYNCPMLTQIPEFYYNLPELQAFNLACNRGISAQQFRADFTKLASSKIVGPKIQILYMGYNNLEELPENNALKNMTKLGLLDLTHNKVKKLHPFGSHVRLASLYLDNNLIEEIPANFCGFTEEVETLGFAFNKLKKIPNIFDANTVFVMGGVNFSHNEIDGVEDPENFKGINAATVTLSFNKFEKFPKELFTSGSPITMLDMSNNLMTEIPEGSIKGKKAYLLGIIDLRFNKLTKLSDDFRSTTLPYLTNMDLSYNCFTEVPPEPLNSANLRAIGIRHQRDAKGNRTLRKWPTGITLCPSLTQLQIGSNDIRKVDETLTSRMYILDIADNPNISIDVTSICPLLEAGLFRLFYDKTQDIRGCDALGIEH